MIYEDGSAYLEAQNPKSDQANPELQAIWRNLSLLPTVATHIGSMSKHNTDGK